MTLEFDQPETEIGPMKKRYADEQIIGFLREADAGLPIKTGRWRNRSAKICSAVFSMVVPEHGGRPCWLAKADAPEPIDETEAWSSRPPVPRTSATDSWRQQRI